MMRRLRRASLLVAFCLLTSAATTSAECAWVLWVEDGHVSNPQKNGTWGVRTRTWGLDRNVRRSAARSVVFVPSVTACVPAVELAVMGKGTRDENLNCLARGPSNPRRCNASQCGSREILGREYEKQRSHTRLSRCDLRKVHP